MSAAMKSSSGITSGARMSQRRNEIERRREIAQRRAEWAIFLHYWCAG